MEPPAASAARRIPFQEDGRLPAPQRDALFVCSPDSCPEGWAGGYSPPMRLPGCAGPIEQSSPHPQPRGRGLPEGFQASALPLPSFSEDFQPWDTTASPRVQILPESWGILKIFNNLWGVVTDHSELPPFNNRTGS